MFDINKISRIYFVGIGGIGMSALARYCKSRGIAVNGYDKTETVLTKQLVQEGIGITYNDDLNTLDKEAQLVVYTPAIPANHQQFNYYKNHQYTVVKRSDLLSAVTNSSFSICVAGTHGKTTTSTMIAHILRDSGFGCNAFLGGIAANYNNNFWSNNNNVCVVEADEYDRTFLKLTPDVAIITAVDADHLDIYGTEHDVQQAFVDFSTKIKPSGILISKFGLFRSEDFVADNKLTYHINETKANAHAINIKTQNGSYVFDVVAFGRTLNNVVLNMGGSHNIENSIAAITVAMHLEIDDEKIKAAVANFKGVKRRFEYIQKDEEHVMIDDYAHHPAELSALIDSAKKLFPERKCTVIFQPHLYSRTKDFADGFAESLDMADEVLLLPIYPARELPMEGVTSAMITDRMKNSNKKILSKSELIDWVKNNETSLLITAGAGDIDTLVDPIKQIIAN